jgi:secreted trypsin-like serine protease
MSQQQYASLTEQKRRLIVGGNDALPHRFPFFVTLDRNCGGALIAPDVVLTAGHCMPKHLDDIGELHVGTYYYAVDVDTTVTSDYDQETFQILQAVRHSYFQRVGSDDDEFRYDFTLLKLDGRSSQPVIRINRDPSIPAPQQQLTAIGLGYLYDVWAADDDGLEDRRPVRPDVLQQVNLQYLPNEECRKASREGKSYSDPPDRIGPTHLCTFTPPGNERDACAYDSGGPIILPDRSTTNGESDNPNDKDHDLLVALVSWGIGCADPVFPGVNARVSSVSDWIDKHVCRLSVAAPPDFKCATTTTSTTPTTSKTTKWFSFSHQALALGWTAVAVALFLVLLPRLLKRWFYLGKEKSDRKNWLFESMDSFLPLKRRSTSETDPLLNSSDSDDDLVSYGSNNNMSDDTLSISRV